MPSPVQSDLFAAVIMFATVVIALPAQAQITDADRAGQRTFTACLDESDGSEEICIEKLGRFAWYPRDEAACDAVGVRVEKVIELDGLPKWRHMYMNERCARMGLPHGAKGAASGGRVDRVNPMARCVNADPWNNFCMDKYGRQGWHPFRDNVCPRNAKGLTRQRRDSERHPWSMLFYNERCRRLGMNYFKAPQ